MMNKPRSTSLALSLLLLGQLACALSGARAGDFDLQSTTDTSKGMSDMDTKGAVDEGHFGRQRFTLTFDTRFGYDDNTLAQPDTARVVTLSPTTGLPVSRTVNVNQSDSAFFNFALGVGYTAANPRLTLTVGADVGVNYYFDRPGRDYDINGGLSVRVTYKASPRLILEASSYNAYESQGDYGATALTNFNGIANGSTSVPGTSAQRNGDYFYTTNYLAATYLFAPRLSLVLSNVLIAFAYDDTPYSTDEDRIETYPQIELRYLVQPDLSLAFDYRFGYIDYFSVSNDSTTHFILGGADYTFSPRLRGSFRAGVEFRSYVDANNADETSPYGEGTVTYDINRFAHLTYEIRYSIEEGDLTVAASKADTLRTGFTYEQNFTPRLSAYLGFYYTHAYYETPNPDLTTSLLNASNFNEDTFDVAAGARFAINRHFSAEIGYTHTSVLSQVDERQYDRNRVFAGVRFAY